MSDRRPSRGERSREQILEAAETLLASDGYAAMTIARLEQACDLPASSIYWHFGSKEGVLTAVLERGANRFLAFAGRMDEIDGTPMVRARAVLDALAGHLATHPHFLRLLLGLSFHGPVHETTRAIVREVRERGLRLAHDVAAVVVEASGQEIDKETLDAMGRLIMATADGLIFATHLQEPVDVELFMQRLVPMLIAVAQTEGRPMRRAA